MQSDKENKKIKEGFLGQKMLVIPPEIGTKIMKNPICNNLFFTAIGYYPKANFHDREREKGAEQYILLYCVDGHGSIIINQVQYSLEPNQYFLLPKNETHHYFSSKENPWSIYWVHFDGEASDHLYRRFTKILDQKLNLIPYEENRIAQFDLIFSVVNNSFNTQSLELANLILHSFLASFIYYEQIGQEKNPLDQVSKSIKFMKDHLDQSFSIEDLAHEMNLSVSHYSSLFKKKTGFSPILYFNNLKIHQSCQYLFFTDMSIKEICNKIGFNDPYYFSRLFKKSMGISPHRYRNKHQNKID